MHTAVSIQPSPGQRFASLALMMALHLVVLWALLQMVTKTPVAIRAREIFLRISVPRQERITPAPPPPRQAQRPRGAPVLGARPLPAPVIPAPDLRGLGQSVFGCAPENLPNLSADQRSHCHGLARPDDSLLVEPPSHVKDPQRRAAEMRAKNTPGNIPCTYVAVDPSFGNPVPAASLGCLADGVFGKDIPPLTGLPK